MAPSSGRLKRPLTLKLDVGGDNLKYLDVAKAFFDHFGPASIRCCQPKSRGLFHVTCSTNEDYAKILGAGALKIGHGSFQVSPVDSDELMIIVSGAPYELDQAVVSSSLRPYGDVLSWEYEADKEYPQLTNGNRVIKIKVRSPVPNVIMAGSYRVNVQYRGVKRQCYKCGASEHLARECTNEDRRWVQKAADRALEEYEQSLQSLASQDVVPVDSSSEGPDPPNSLEEDAPSSRSRTVSMADTEKTADHNDDGQSSSSSDSSGSSQMSQAEVQPPDLSSFPAVPSSWAENPALPLLAESSNHLYSDTLKNTSVPVDKPGLPAQATILRKTGPPTSLVPTTTPFVPVRTKTNPKRPGSGSLGLPRKKASS